MSVDEQIPCTSLAFFLIDVPIQVLLQPRRRCSPPLSPRSGPLLEVGSWNMAGGRGGGTYHMFEDLTVFGEPLDLEQVRETQKDKEKGSQLIPNAET